jgi:predicted house-cleaning noncanonical NTP pyrophosphatase (MazG superfamily)
MTIYCKLVRDRIPEIIDRAGKVPIYRHMDADEYKTALRAKLVEEAQEVAAAGDGNLIAELADVAEVVDALLDIHDISKEALIDERHTRTAERGSFSRRLFLERVEG